jgi:hypothetical protein
MQIACKRGLEVRYWLVNIIIVAGLAASGMAKSEGDSPHLAEQAFTEFARGWLGSLSQEAPQPGNAVRFLSPKEPGQTETFTYRDYDEDFAIRTKPTGNAESPFVGILSYTENVYVCRGPTRDDCELVESSPITEIFPFRDGRWQY